MCCVGSGRVSVGWRLGSVFLSLGYKKIFKGRTRLEGIKSTQIHGERRRWSARWWWNGRWCRCSNDQPFAIFHTGYSTYRSHRHHCRFSAGTSESQNAYRMHTKCHHRLPSHSPRISLAFPSHSPRIPLAFPSHSPRISLAFPSHFPRIARPRGA